MGCSYFQGAPPSAIGLSIILLILTDPPHASVQTSILGESDGGPLPCLSLFLPSVTEALPYLDAAPRNEAALASASLSTSARSSCSCGCAIADLSVDHISGGSQSIVMASRSLGWRKYRAPGSCNSRGSCTTHTLLPSRHLIGSKSKTAYIRSTQAQSLLPPRGEPRS